MTLILPGRPTPTRFFLGLYIAIAQSVKDYLAGNPENPENSVFRHIYEPVKRWCQDTMHIPPVYTLILTGKMTQLLEHIFARFK